MKINFLSATTGLLLGLACCLPPAVSLHAASTINPVNQYAYAANLGWINAYANGTHGAVIGEYVCSGYLYAANVGWIHLGSGSPANGIQYQNNSATDYGINCDASGKLTGYAYAANIGWLNFEQTYGQPRVDLRTGNLSGAVWSANCGWISLSNAVARVQTDTIAPGADTDGDGLADAWELSQFGNLTTANATSDYDGDGASDQNEYLAGTNPKDANDKLVITSATFAAGGTNVDLTWQSQPTRFYHLEKALGLSGGGWLDSGLGLITPNAGLSTSRTFADTNAPNRFYRVKAVRPLTP